MTVYGFWRLVGDPALAASFDPGRDLLYLPVSAAQVSMTWSDAGTSFVIDSARLTLPMQPDQIRYGSNLRTADGSFMVGDDRIENQADGWANALSGSPGNDQYWGLAGNDIYDGGAGGDLIYGGAGADRLLGGSGHDVIYGNQDNDRIFGGLGVDTLYGGQGHDVMDADRASDVVYGNLGADLINGGGGLDLVFGGQGNDTIHGGAGNDTVLGNRGDDDLYGDDGADVIRGGAGRDILDGGRGSDRLMGDAERDTLYGGAGPGRDTLLGGAGADDLYSEEGGADILAGGPGADYLYAGAFGTDVMVGGTGADRFFFYSAEALATAWTQSGWLYTAQPDRINDFVAGEDQLWLDIDRVLDPRTSRFVLLTEPAVTPFATYVGVQTVYTDVYRPTTTLGGFAGVFRNTDALTRHVVGLGGGAGTTTYYGFALNTTDGVLWIFQGRDLWGGDAIDTATVLYSLRVSGSIAASDIILF